MRLLALVLLFCLAATAAFARGGGASYFVSGATTASTCPFGSALSDGCTGAQAHGTIVNSHAMDPNVVLDLNIIGGSGYTNGTFAWTSSGGGCLVNATGNLTVSGGELGGGARGLPANFTISNPGAGCTSRPTVAIPAGASGGTGGSITSTVYQLTAHNASTVWNVAAVDYPVGYDTTLTLADPTAGGLPGCASFASATVTINSSNCTINGWDFSLHPTHLVVAGGLSNVVISNNKFGCAASQLDEIHINPGTTGTTIKYNYFNSNSTASGGCNLSGGQDAAISSKATGGTLTIEYNYCVNQDSKCISIGPSAAVPFSMAIIEEYNYWQDYGGCNCGSHAEAEYAFSSQTLGANVVLAWTQHFNTMLIDFWYGPTNATSAASIEADGTTMNSPDVQNNIEISRGTQSYTGSANGSGQSGAAPMFCSSQESGSYTGAPVQKNNLLDYSGGFYPYDSRAACQTSFPNLADFNLGTGNSCNGTTCN